MNKINKTAPQEDSVYETFERLQTEIKREMSKNDIPAFFVFSLSFLILPATLIYVLFIDNRPITIIVASLIFVFSITFIVKRFKHIRLESPRMLALKKELAEILPEKEKLDKEQEEKERAVNESSPHFNSPPSYTPQIKGSWDFLQLFKFLIAFVLTVAVFANWGVLAGLVIGFILWRII